ncbi:DUF5655 domain-containing protein [Synoicihabitans lomoniglobus]|uniref:DUF5655 domain-containing protein n=2 Tax=Synoicihabitans lomoniglobus TaxID=2909285 RepID=A0AAE9ZXV4_9BACT|nr:DUF5655 domain-containing protein [Opitutaceae bacterium LMO-M01]
MIKNLETKTGVAWSEWLARAHAAGSEKHGEIVKHLKSEHGIGHGYANLVAHSAKAAAAGGPAEADDLVAAQYAGKKAGLKPIYEALIATVEKFGPDVELAAKKGYVSLRRKKQFGLVQPSTATRLDVGITLKGTVPTARLEASGGFNAMVSHRVRISTMEEIDAELVGWLRLAYDNSG